MKIKIGLSFADKSTAFWFTTSGKVHLSTQAPEKEIETEKLSSDDLRQIASGLYAKTLVCNNKKEFFELLANVKEQEFYEKEVFAEKSFADNKKLAEISNRISLENIKDLLGSSTKSKINRTSDVELLKAAKEFESEKSNPRKDILRIIDKRLEILKQDTIEISVEEIETISEEEYKSLFIDTVNKTISETEPSNEVSEIEEE